MPTPTPIGAAWTTPVVRTIASAASVRTRLMSPSWVVWSDLRAPPYTDDQRNLHLLSVRLAVERDLDSSVDRADGGRGARDAEREQDVGSTQISLVLDVAVPRLRLLAEQPKASLETPGLAGPVGCVHENR